MYYLAEIQSSIEVMSIENYQNHLRFRQVFTLIGGNDNSIVTPEMFPYT